MNKKEHIKNYIINQIVGGQLNVGDKILSERKISKLLNISRTTIRNAFQELSFANWLESRIGSGYFVSGYGSYDTLFTKGRYKIKFTTIEDINLKDKALISKYFDDNILKKNKIFIKKYFDEKNELQIFTINIVNKDYAFYLDNTDIKRGFIQSLLNHGIKLSFQNRNIYIHDKNSHYSASTLGWKHDFPVIISSLHTNKWIVEWSIMIMHKNIFHFNKKVIF